MSKDSQATTTRRLPADGPPDFADVRGPERNRTAPPSGPPDWSMPIGPHGADDRVSDDQPPVPDPDSPTRQTRSGPIRPGDPDNAYPVRPGDSAETLPPSGPPDWNIRPGQRSSKRP